MRRFLTLALAVALIASWLSPASASTQSAPEAFGLPIGQAPISRAATLAAVAPTDNVLVTYPTAYQGAASRVDSETTLISGTRSSVSVMAKIDAQAFAETHPKTTIETDKPMHLDEINTSPSWNQDRIDQRDLSPANQGR